MNLIGWRSIDLSDISGKVGRKRSALRVPHCFTVGKFSVVSSQFSSVKKRVAVICIQHLVDFRPLPYLRESAKPADVPSGVGL